MFKGLGGTYAMFRILCRALGLDPEKADFSEFRKTEVREKTAKYTFVTATDGNHGKGVSWASELFGAHAYVYMPKGTAKAREDAVRQAGPAEVTVTDWNYDDPVIISGESGASTMGAVLMLLERPELEKAGEALELGADSVILLINTEGDTDPVSYRNIVEYGVYPLP